MKRPSPFVWIAFFVILLAQQAEAQVHAHTNQKITPVAGSALLSTGFSGTGANIDVIYQKCDWTIDPTVAKNIAGTITITFVTKQANVSTINFDLNKTSFNNASLSVKYLGSAVPFSFPTTGNVNIINITLPSPLAINTTATVVITYSGAPPAVNGQAEGYQRKQDAAGNWYIYTLSESYEDRDWFPCKADMQDKIDQMDIWITCPNGYRAATNGAFVDSNTVVGGFRTFKYQTKHPIASYLVAVGVAKYFVYVRTPVTIGGTSVPVWYWLFPDKSAATYTSIISYLDKSRTEIANFSAKYGNYGFTDEKHGYYEFGWGGGMEHQSFIAMGSGTLTTWSIIAHELGHQWFGDKVSFATWNELWLAEAFASYSESLAIELDPSLSGSESPVTVRTTFKNAARSLSTTEVYIPNSNITNSNTLWGSNYGNSVYQKGAMVVSMLRMLVGDTKFFQALQNYQSDPLLVYKSATTADLERNFESVVSGYDLSRFFTDWVMGKGQADYTIKWNNSGTKLAIQIASQTRSSGATSSYFYTPVVLKVSNGVTSTKVVIYDQNGKLSYAGNGISAPITTNTLSYNLSFTPTTVTFDPDAETMSTGTTTKDGTINPLSYTILPVNIIDFKGVKTALGNQLSLQLASMPEKVSVLAERSDDGTSFSAIGAMLKTGASDQGDVYSFQDRTFSNAHAFYYRAKMVDASGTVSYSNVVRLQNDVSETGGISIRPNTVSDVLKIFLSGGWANVPVSLTVYNSAGMAVLTKQCSAAGSVQVPVQQLPADAYQVQVVRPDGEAASKPFIIMR